MAEKRRQSGRPVGGGGLATGLLCAALLAVPTGCPPQRGPGASAGSGRTALWGKLALRRPEDVGMDNWCLQQIDHVVADGLRAGQMPGCVVAVGRRGGIVFRKAYGDRQVEPAREAMTLETVFDVASLTKPVATATCVMLLVEAGKVDPGDRVSDHLPQFGQAGKKQITVAQLLTHQGGLVADNHLREYANGADEAWRRICASRPIAKPGSRFIYSDVGYIVLAELVRRVSGRDVHELATEKVYGPLGMSDTTFLPGEPLQRRAAPTERRDGEWIRGQVHDPRAWRLGGVAGHAGLFSTAGDLATFASMMLGGGEFGGVRVLSEASIERMTRPRKVPGRGLRSLGWDVRTGYSTNRGRALSDRAFGHGGFTGTSLWIDPQLDLFVLFLSNRLHPDGKGAVNLLAGRIGTIAGAAARMPKAEAATRPRPAPGGRRGRSGGKVLTGLDVLRREGFAALAGRRVGLLTNHTGIAGDGRSNIELLAEADAVKLVKILTPEHGLEGLLDQAQIADARHGGTGLPVVSLYGKTRKPTPEMLADVDTLVFDIQDIGARFYTYISTMGLAMQAAAEAGKRFVVLDRPNPIGGLDVAGPVLDAGRETFVGFHRLPVRHGMTVGELARLFRAELKLQLDLHVVRVERWRRGELFDATGLRWVNPSPNMRSLTEALLYPGIGLLEATNLSVGRGTETPFELVGAPWIDEKALGERLTRSGLPGVSFEPIRFTPTASKHEGRPCGGVRITITDRSALRPIRTGLEIARLLNELYGEQWRIDGVDHLLRNRLAMASLKRGRTAVEIEWTWQTELGRFMERRAAVLLYE